MRVADYLAPRAFLSQRPLRRDAVVAAVSTPTPRLRRIVLEGPSLADIRSERFDDHVKLAVPDTDARRSYTIRHVDATSGSASGRVTLDCVLHGEGPASLWAERVRPGDTAAFFGPKPRPAYPFAETCVLFGDATALPAIARCLETAARHAAHVHAFVVLDDMAERQDDLVPGRAQDTLTWLAPDGRRDFGWARLRQAARNHDWSSDGTIAWIAAETSLVRRLRSELIEEEALVPARIRAAGYWRAGVADGGARM